MIDYDKLEQEMTMVGRTKYFKYRECEVNQVLAYGKYVREFEGQYGTQYEILDRSGAPHVLNGNADLKRKMDLYTPEKHIVKVVYKGEEPITKGRMAGKSMHLFEVGGVLNPEFESATKPVKVEGAPVVDAATNLDEFETDDDLV